MTISYNPIFHCFTDRWYPSCPAKCDDLENGFYFNNGAGVGHKIYYVCDDGYKLQGNAVQECAYGNKWFPNGETKCVCK